MNIPPDWEPGDALPSAILLDKLKATEEERAAVERAADALVEIDKWLKRSGKSRREEGKGYEGEVPDYIIAALEVDARRERMLGSAAIARAMEKRGGQRVPTAIELEVKERGKGEGVAGAVEDGACGDDLREQDGSRDAESSGAPH